MNISALVRGGWPTHRMSILSLPGDSRLNVSDRSGTLAALCNCLLQARIDFKMQRMYIAMALEMMFRFVRPMPVIIYLPFCTRMRRLPHPSGTHSRNPENGGTCACFRNCGDRIHRLDDVR